MFDYFKYEDFDSPDVRGSGLITHVDLIKMLDKARSIYGKPIYVTSGYRTKLHNKKVGGVSNSSHLRGFTSRTYFCSFNCHFLTVLLIRPNNI